MTDKTKREIAGEICAEWGWTFAELMYVLENGGSSLHPMKTLSATQTAHAIIKNLLENPK